MKASHVTLFLFAVLGISFIILFKFTATSSIEVEAGAAGIGPIIQIAGVQAKSDEGHDIVNIINNSGMSGTDGRNHTHSKEEKTMWKYTTQGAEDVSIILDLGLVHPLGELWVWNYMSVQDGESFSHFGLKDIRIYHSTDDNEWQEWKGEGYPFRLAKQEDDQTATNLATQQSPIQFNGLPARYIKIEASTEPGKGNWAEKDGERVVGLSEIRVFRHHEKVVGNGRISPVSAAMEGDSPPQQGPENLINYYGLYSLEEGRKETHGTDSDTMWLSSPANGEQPSITVDLGGTYPLATMEVWNYNEPGKENHGLKKVKIFHSLDGNTWTELAGEGHPYQLAKSDGNAQILPTNQDTKDAQAIEFDGIQARFVKITPEEIEGNWGAEGYYGLSEISFNAGIGTAVEPLYEWNELFSKYSGWTGADGIYSIPFAEDKKILFLFSDTFVGEVHPVSRQRLQPNMLNNSLAVLEGKEPDPANMEWIITADITDVNLFTPKTPNSPTGSWYWLQDGLKIENDVYIFPLLMNKDLDGEAGFQFAIIGVNMIKLPMTDDGPIIEEQVQVDTPLFTPMKDGSGNIVFGAGILDQSESKNEGYLYVYGYKDLKTGTKELVVARVKPSEIEEFKQWQYWDGTDWTDQIHEVASLVTGVSPELSVTYMEEGLYQGKYLLVAEKDTLSGYIAVSQADSPEGPFSELEDIYFVPEADLGNGVITYNAKAHPQLSPADELYITYNVNTSNPIGNNSNGDIYRPRWLKIRELKAEAEE